MEIFSYEDRKAIYLKAIEVYGTENQEKVAVEEMSELTKEICKFWRGLGKRSALAEEIADVTIMLEQLRIIFNLNIEVNAAMDVKISRLQDAIEDWVL